MAPAVMAGHALAAIAALTVLAMPVDTAHAQTTAGSTIGAAASGIELRAQVVPARSTTLSAEIASRVERLPLEPAERFQDGALLVQLDCRLQETQLARAQAERLSASHTVEGNRQLESMQAIGAVDVARSEADLLKAEADVRYLETVLERCSIRAPFAGRIVGFHVQEYAFVQAGTPLVDLIDDRQLELEFVLPSRWLAWLEPDMAFAVDIEDTGRRYPVRLKSTAAEVDPLSQTVSGKAVIEGVHPGLLPGMSGRLVLSPPPRQ